MWLVPSTISVKSVIAGEYTAPPAQGPMTPRLRHQPDASRVPQEHVGVGAERQHAFLDARRRIVEADERARRYPAPVMSRRSSWRWPRSCAAETVKSWAKQVDEPSSTFPAGDTPSPTMRFWCHAEGGGRGG